MTTDAIKLYLISGFLGAGKTTFLRRLLAEQPAGKTGVIVNEFGDVGIDGKLIQRGDIRLIELTNGSIFCSCLKDNFVRTLKAFSGQPIESLFIESSGLADPSSMNIILRGLAPYLTRPYEPQGNICLVDCTTFLDYVEMLLPTQKQVMAADLILLNKTDLADEKDLREIRTAIDELNPVAIRYETTYGQLPAAALSEMLVNHFFEAETDNLPESRPDTCIFDLSGAATKTQLEGFCSKLQPYIWRIKGFAQAPDGWWQVDATGGQVEVEPSSLTSLHPQYANRLVIIWRDAETAAAHQELLTI